MVSFYRCWSLGCMAALLFSLAAAPALAQGAGESPAQDLAKTLETLRASVAADSSLAEEARKELDDALTKSQSSLDKLIQQKGEIAALQAQIDGSARQIQEYKDRVNDIQSAPVNLERRLGEEPTLAVMEAEIGIVAGQRKTWADERKAALDSLATMARYEGELRSQLTELSRRLESQNTGDTAKSGDGPAGLRERVMQHAAKVQRAAVENEIALIELKLRSEPVLSTIRTAKIAWLDAAISESDSLLEELRSATAKQRENAATQRAAEMRRILSELADASPEFQDFARGNLTLVDGLQNLGNQIASSARGLAELRQTRERIEQDASLTERRLEVAGLEAQLGEVMLSRLASLPDASGVLSSNSNRNELIAKMSIDAIDTEQALRQSGDRAGFIAMAFGDISDLSSAQRRSLDRLYEQRQELLQETVQAQNTLLRSLVDENQAAAELASEVKAYETLLTANLLWVRNYSFTDPAKALQRLRRAAAAEPLESLITHWPWLLSDSTLLLLMLILALLLLRKRRIKKWLNSTLGSPIRPRDESTRLALQATALTLLSAMPLSVLLCVIGRSAEVLAQGDIILAGLADMLYGTALLLLILRFLGTMGGRLGAGRRLLKWNSTKADLLIGALRWFRPGVVLGAALAVLGGGLSPTDSGGAVGALGSLLIAVFILAMAITLLRSGLFTSDRIIQLALRGGALVAAAIIVMHLSGQLFAAHLYLRALSGSIVAVLGILLVTNILMRAIILHRAKMERKSREELRVREDTANEVDATAQLEAEESDTVTSLSEAFARLLGLARVLSLGALLWLIWSPALPALSIFDSVTLWSTIDLSIADGGVRNITLGVLLFALVVIALTFIVTRQLPPLINVMLMEWSSVTPGTRYAAGMLMQYVIIGAGLSTALSMLGFQWGKVQWLVAALGVGIGFGLQEIVANFISGLIVLFERPIRVGDVINAGGNDGTVTRINARATVIETFEGKEVMIPNKELITSVVTNWSLTSSKLRVVVPIGIAYGSDVDDAMMRLTRLAGEHPEVLDDPQPWVTFEDFGDNALVLWLRCHALRDYVRIATELRQNIYREFNEAGIGISFPQRDVHLDASEPLPIRILPPDAPDPA